MVNAVKSGAQLLDVRDPVEFAARHVAGSINIGLGGQYATWAGTLLDRGRPIVIIASPGREAEAAVRLGRIGFDNVAGYLDGGMQTLRDRDDLLAATPQASADSVNAWLGAPDAPYLLDVRTPGEWQQQHIEGSENIPLSRLAGKVGELPRNRPIVVFCAGGYRSSIAGSLLQREGFSNVAEMTGGMSAWAVTAEAS
jgi:rhodanese-related sulfurtransferase